MNKKPNPKREEAERLMDIWLDHENSEGRDAGFTGQSVFGLIMDFMGEPPKGSGFDQSNLTMINAMRLYRGEHYLYKPINEVVQRLLRNSETAKHIIAFMVSRAIVGLNKNMDRAFNREDKATIWAAICQSRHNIDLKIMTEAEMIAAYRYGAESCGPRLLLRDFKMPV